jgi:hypothetical protein
MAFSWTGHSTTLITLRRFIRIKRNDIIPIEHGQ